MKFLQDTIPATKMIIVGMLCLVLACSATIVGAAEIVRGLVDQRAMTRVSDNMLVAWHLVGDHGGFKVGTDGRLRLGDVPLPGDDSFVDELTGMIGGVATVTSNDVRVSTTVRLPDGRRAVGSRVVYQPALDAVLKRHIPFRGVSPILGGVYYAAYDPIRDRRGKVIGLLFVGVPRTGLMPLISQAFGIVGIVSAGCLILSGVLFLGIGRRLAKRIEAREEELSQTNERLDTAMGNMANGLAVWGSDNTLILANRRLAEIMRIPQASLRPGTSLRDLVALSVGRGHFEGASVDQVVAHRLALVRGGRETTFLTRTGDGRRLSVNYRPLAGGRWLTTYDDVTESVVQQERLAFLARHDALTGLANRILFNERLDAALESGVELRVLCLDLDHFKAVNDTLGHPAGDALLREASARLLSCVRENDMVARLGGDEFAVIQEVSSNRDDAGSLADRLIEEISAPYQILGHVVVVGTSIGVASSLDDGRDANVLLVRADMALYAAKEAGRNCHRLYAPEMGEALAARRDLENDLRLAVGTGAISLAYQPLVDARTERVRGFEALMRWTHPVRGNVPPSEFIPVAEESGLIVELGAWAIRRACSDAAAWPSDVGIAVNLSAVQFKSPSLTATVREALHDSGLAPERLELEITESVLLRDLDATREVLDGLRDLGVRIAMDDFGTGYASLAYLNNFPFDKIKIDRSFVTGLGTRRDSDAIVRAVMGLAADLGMQSLAEGVETSEQLERLRAQGCDQVQGYLLGRPLPASEATTTIARLNSAGWRCAAAA